MTTVAALVFAVVVCALIYHSRHKRQHKCDLEPCPPATPTRVRRPRVKGLTPEQREAERLRFVAEVRQNHIAAFERDKAAALAIGSEKYIWRSCGDSDVCPTCRKNNGKKFSWHIAPPHGHPGSGICQGEGYCRCYAEPVISR